MAWLMAPNRTGDGMANEMTGNRTSFECRILDKFRRVVPMAGEARV
jgi:hypothetical protein